jgi:tetratricopeptide (TPR) repeat protein
MTETQPAQHAFERIRMLCDLRRFDEAATLARRAIATTPDEAEAWCLLAQALLGTEKYGLALDAAGRAAAIAPEDEWPHRLRSIALSALHRDTDALAAALESVRCEPFVWVTHGRVASASAACGMKDQALAAAAKAVELGPNEARAWVTAGDVSAKCGKPKEAEQYYAAALRLDPQSADAHNGLGRLRLKGRGPNAAGLAAATAGFATAVRTDPRAQNHRRGIDVVLRVFLARASYFIFLVSYLSARGTSGSSSTIARLLPVVLLLAPAAFVWRFVAKLTPDVRAHLLRTLRQGFIAVAAAAEVLAVVAILVGAMLPEKDRTAAAIVAVAAGLGGRLALFAERRRTFPEFSTVLARWKTLGWIAVAGIAICGFLFLVLALSGTPGSGSSAIAAAVFILLAGLLALALRRSRR